MSHDGEMVDEDSISTLTFEEREYDCWLDSDVDSVTAAIIDQLILDSGLPSIKRH
jgi:hypothetical protein